jgi:hypothetical protein
MGRRKSQINERKALIESQQEMNLDEEQIKETEHIKISKDKKTKLKGQDQHNNPSKRPKKNKRNSIGLTKSTVNQLLIFRMLMRSRLK